MITKCFNSAPARFAVYICANNGLEIFAKQSKSISHCIRSFSPQYQRCDAIQIIKICSSNYIHRSNCHYKKNTRRCSSDVVQFAKRSSKCFSDFTPSKNIVSLIETKSNAVLFSQFKSKPFGSPYLLQTNKNTLEYLKGLPKSFWFRQRNNDGKKPKRRIPKLILLQNPFTWLMIKIDFGVLRSLWDPSFTEKEFKDGTKQAISRVTDVISQGQFSELNGLLTKAARLSLMRELDRNWSDKQRSLLALKLEDIQISSPRKVYFIRIADKKYCDVDMAFLALKWAPINSIEALIFTEIFARFHREYTPHCIPEWTIAYFKVTRFEVLRKKAKMT